MIREVAVAEYQARRFWSTKEPVSVQVRDMDARGGGTAHHRPGIGTRRQLQQHVQSRRDSQDAAVGQVLGECPDAAAATTAGHDHGGTA